VDRAGWTALEGRVEWTALERTEWTALEVRAEWIGGGGGGGQDSMGVGVHGAGFEERLVVQRGRQLLVQRRAERVVLHQLLVRAEGVVVQR
jgi:hypothetical protein